MLLSLSPQYKGKATADLGGSKLLFNLSPWLMRFVVNKSAAVHARMSLFPVTSQNSTSYNNYRHVGYATGSKNMSFSMSITRIIPRELGGSGTREGHSFAFRAPACKLRAHVPQAHCMARTFLHLSPSPHNSLYSVRSSPPPAVSFCLPTSGTPPE